MDHSRDREIEEAIEHRVDSIIEQVMWYLSEEQELYRQRAMTIISECDGDDMTASDLTMEQQLEIVEEGADEHGFEDMTFSLDRLRNEMESHACMFIQMLAEGRTYGIFEELFDFMDEHDIEPEQMRESNNFGWLPHVAEREEGACVVYEYRNVEEPGNHVDVWEYRLENGSSVYFEQRFNK